LAGLLGTAGRSIAPLLRGDLTAVRKSDQSSVFLQFFRGCPELANITVLDIMMKAENATDALPAGATRPGQVRCCCFLP
jgi:hypothetical protein